MRNATPSEPGPGLRSRLPAGPRNLLGLAFVLAALLLWRGDAAGPVLGGLSSAGGGCYTLTLNVGGGSGTVLAMPDSSGSCTTGQYTPGYPVAVLASPAPGYQFSSWSGTDNNNYSSTTVAMTGDRTATAYFTANCYALTLNVGGGSGTVQAMPTSSGGCPEGQYTLGYTVGVTATPGAGYLFSNWTGTDNNGNSSTTVTMNSNRTATAYFTLNCYSLTLNVGGGSGSVQAMPANAGGCPNAQYPAGYVVAVVATPGSGYQWSSWSGTDNNSNSSTTVTMNGNRSATVYFTLNCYQLTLNVGGGNGTVLAMPANAGGCPNGQYPAGYVVAVLATPGGGSQFSSWSGTDNNANSSTTVTMNGNRTATAYFGSNCFRLTLNVGGGVGTVLAMPANAGGCPNGQYPAGYVVAVVATPGGGSQFSSWSGTDNNNNSSTTVTMNGDRTATAYFGSNCFQLTLNVGGGTGTVLAMPTSAGSCPNGQYPGGYAVAVLATPGSGYQFSSWTGTDNNGNSTTTVTMNGARTATAYFAVTGGPPPPTLTPTPTPTRTPTPPPGSETDTPTRTPTRTPSLMADEELRGDADCSGHVNAIDAALVLQLGANLLSRVPCPLGADANGDGDIDAIDAALILQYGAGLLSGL